MKNCKYFISLLITIFVFASCRQSASTKTSGTANEWKQQFNATLPLLGHRNWIIIADKAFPQQNADGMEYINTNENLLLVLSYVLKGINASAHVRPIIYRDKELGFITEEQCKGVENFLKESQQLFGSQPVQTFLHDSVFVKLDAASKLFKVLVLKTNETIPYTSVFLQLNCAYWNTGKEEELRKSMDNK